MWMNGSCTNIFSPTEQIFFKWLHPWISLWLCNMSDLLMFNSNFYGSKPSLTFSWIKNTLEHPFVSNQYSIHSWIITGWPDTSLKTNSIRSTLSGTGFPTIPMFIFIKSRCNWRKNVLIFVFQHVPKMPLLIAALHNINPIKYVFAVLLNAIIKTKYYI